MIVKFFALCLYFGCYDLIITTGVHILLLGVGFVVTYL